MSRYYDDDMIEPGEGGCDYCWSIRGDSVACTEGHGHRVCGACKGSVLYRIPDSEQFVCPDSLEEDSKPSPGAPGFTDSAAEEDDEHEDEELPL